MNGSLLKIKIKGLCLIVAVLLPLLMDCSTAKARALYSDPGGSAQMNAAKALLERVAPGISGQFILRMIPSDHGKDVFELESANGKIVLSGNNGVSIASAFNYYLKNYCNCLYSLWGDQMKLPKTLPVIPKKVRVHNEKEFRHFFNYCTTNYSGSWWNWDDWQKIIDFLAMNGINMPLNIIGTEAVWYHTLIEMGLTDKEAREYLAAPVYLNWQWMGNLEGTGGPLPKSWIDSHEKLGRQIMEREQSLGMTPIVHGFSGVVPRIFKKKFPNAKIDMKPEWGRGSFIGTATLDPMDPLFPTIAKKYLSQLLKRIGSSHLYITDPFHESNPPVEGDVYLQEVARSIDKVLLEVDPKAIWVTQDWTLRPQIIKSIPKDRLIIMSLTGGKCDEYKDWGYRFTIGQLNGFGGETFLHGPLTTAVENDFAKMKAKSSNCVGTGLWMEGIEGDPANYHLMLDLNWENGAIDLQKWLAGYSSRRYGASSTSVEKSNLELTNSAYKRGSKAFSSIIASRPAIFPIKSGPASRTYEISGGLDKYVKAWMYLLEEKDRFAGSKGYQYDVVDLGRQVLSFLAQYYQRDIAIHLYRKDLANFRKSRDRFLTLIDDMDRLLGTNEHFLFGKWVSDARSWGTTKEESDYYAKYAAIHPTLWGQDNPDYSRPNWFDYGWREWNGLVGTYYKHRWEFFLKAVEKELEKGNIYQDGMRDKWGRLEFRGDKTLSELADWEWAYGEHLPEMISKPQGDAVKVAAEILEKYKKVLLGLPPVGPEFGKLFKEATINKERTIIPIDEKIKEAIAKAPYIKN